jgi:hypothetical protein
MGESWGMGKGVGMGKGEDGVGAGVNGFGRDNGKDSTCSSK